MGSKMLNQQNEIVSTCHCLPGIVSELGSDVDLTKGDHEQGQGCKSKSSFPANSLEKVLLFIS